VPTPETMVEGEAAHLLEQAWSVQQVLPGCGGGANISATGACGQTAARRCAASFVCGRGTCTGSPRSSRRRLREPSLGDERFGKNMEGDIQARDADDQYGVMLSNGNEHPRLVKNLGFGR